MGAAAALAAFTYAPKRVPGQTGVPSANDKLNIAAIGAGGMGADNIRKRAGENIVALCDVDAQRTGGSGGRLSSRCGKEQPRAGARGIYRISQPGITKTREY